MKSPRKLTLAEVEQRVSSALKAIEPCFIPEARLTLVMRVPGRPVGDKTGIEWTDSTWSPVKGCSRVSPGCVNCYAETLAGRFCGPSLPMEGFATRTPSGPRWTGRVELAAERLTIPLSWQKPRRIFVNSQSDTFHEKLADEDIARIFVTMALAERHTFQVLTKRADRMATLLGLQVFRRRVQLGAEVALGREPAWPLPNVWLGVSVEDQERADERIPHLLSTPAAVRFLSCEPLLGPVKLKPEWLPEDYAHDFGGAFEEGATEGVDWAIVGGESGRDARPMHPEWARALRDQCESAGVPFFFKQWGEWSPTIMSSFLHKEDAGKLVETNCTASTNPAHVGRFFQAIPSTADDAPGDFWDMRRVGKKAAGALLEGREWRELPGGGP